MALPGIGGGAANLGDLVWSLRSEDVDLTKGIDDSKTKMTGLSKHAAKAAKAIGVAFTAVGAVITGVFASGLKSAISFRDGIKKVETLGVENIKALTDSLKDFAILAGGDAIALTEDLYNTLSAGIPEDAAIMVMESALKGAHAGAGELSSALDAGTSIMNAYNLQGENAVETTRNFEEIMGQLATAIKFGKTTMDDIGGAVGKAAGLMNEAGVSTQEYLSIVAALTTTGVKASEAITGFKAAVASAMKPTKEASDIAAVLGINWNAAALEAEGAVKFFGDMANTIREKNAAMVIERDAVAAQIKDIQAQQDANKGLLLNLGEIKKLSRDEKAQKDEIIKVNKRLAVQMKEAKTNFEGLSLIQDNAAGTMAKVIGSMEGANAVMSFTGSLSNKVADAMAGMANAQQNVNEMAAAYREENPKLILDQTLAGLKVLTMELGEALIPTAIELLTLVSDIVGFARTWIKENPILFATIAKITAAVGAFLLVLGPIIIMLPGIVTFIGIIGPALTILTPIIIAGAAAWQSFFLPILTFVAVAGAGWLFGRWIDGMIDEQFPAFGAAIDAAMDKLVAFLDKIKVFLGLQDPEFNPTFASKEDRKSFFDDNPDLFNGKGKPRTFDDLTGPSNSISTTNNSNSASVNLNVATMVVREDADIKRIASELGKLVERNLRIKGRNFLGA